MKFSVITINYNNSAGLRRTIESVLAQDADNYEYIVVDGASSDGSREVLEEFAGKIGTIVREPDNGVYEAMNKGIDLAEGDYLIFMNSGDCFCNPGVLSEVGRLTGGQDFIYGNTEYSDGRRRLSKNEPALFSYLYMGCWCHQSMFIKSSVLKSLHYDESLKLAADWKLYLQTIVKGDASFLPVDVFVALYDAEGLSSTNAEALQEERARVLKEMFPERMLTDYGRMVNGHTLEDRLYLDLKQSRYHKSFYRAIVFVLRALSIFKGKDYWTKKFPVRFPEE